MKSTTNTSVQQVGPGLYRVSGIRTRSALTGRYITQPNPPRHPIDPGGVRDADTGNGRRK